jgi:hypothetical protein
MTETKSREELALNVDEARWQWLKPHMERGAIVIVASALDLAEAGERMAADDSFSVAGWIDAGLVGKPTAADIARWDAEPQKKFLTLIVSPYVLIQEIGTIN